MGLLFQYFIFFYILVGNNEDVLLEGSKIKLVCNKCLLVVEDCGFLFMGDIYSDIYFVELKL